MPQKHPVLCEVDRRYSMSKIGVQYISTNRSKKPQPKNQQCRVSPNCRCSICLGWFNYRVFSLAGVVIWEWATIQSTASSSEVKFSKMVHGTIRPYYLHAPNLALSHRQ